MSAYWVDWKRVVAIESGDYDRDARDYNAILVFDAGGRLETKLSCAQAAQLALQHRQGPEDDTTSEGRIY